MGKVVGRVIRILTYGYVRSRERRLVLQSYTDWRVTDYYGQYIYIYLR